MTNSHRKNILFILHGLKSVSHVNTEHKNVLAEDAKIDTRQKATKIKLDEELKSMNEEELIEFLKKHGLTEDGYDKLKAGTDLEDGYDKLKAGTNLEDGDMGSYGCDELVKAINEAKIEIKSIDNYKELDESPDQHDICQL